METIRLRRRIDISSLDRLLKASRNGVGIGVEAKEVIQEGLVMVNGQDRYTGPRRLSYGRCCII